MRNLVLKHKKILAITAFLLIILLAVAFLLNHSLSSSNISGNAVAVNTSTLVTPVPIPLPTASASQEENIPDMFSNNLYPIVQDRKWGFIDYNGTVIIKPQYDGVSEFCEGLAAVNISNRYGFINSDNKIVIPLEYDYVGHFKEGFASVRDGENYYFIDMTGEKLKTTNVIRYIDLDFNEGLAVVEFENNSPKKSFINIKGETVFSTEASIVTRFSEGLAAITSGLVWGYIDKEGHYAIEPQFLDGSSSDCPVNSFSDGIAKVSPDTNKKLYGYINKKGKYILKPQKYKCADTFSEGLAYVQNKNGLFGFIDTEGKFVIDPVFKEVSDFSEGLTAVQNEDSKWGYIDNKGNSVIDFSFVNVHDFHEGLAAVQVDDNGSSNGDWAFIDKTGKVVIEPQFATTDRLDRIGDFKDGVAKVMLKDEKFGYVNKDGKILWTTSDYDFCLPH